MSGLDEPGALGRIGRALLAACGDDFHRPTARQRTDDQRVRNLVCELLGQAQRAVVAAEGDWRRERIPPPTRAAPFPPAEVVADARRLEALGQAIARIEGQVRHAPVPDADRTTGRFRDAGETLAALTEKDTLLVGLAERLRQLVADADPEAILAARADLDQGIAALTQALAARQVMLI